LGTSSATASHSTTKPAVAPTVVAAAQPLCANCKSAAVPSGVVVHKVEPGETLWSIAQSYKTTAEALRAGNRFLFTRPLHVGDQLAIPPQHR
jgi:LysM repeat protein